MRSERLVSVIDFHTGGQGMRLLDRGIGPLDGATMAERRADFRARYDDLRTALCTEPRGHREIVMGVRTEPVTPGAAFGLLFMDWTGYQDSCGEGTIGAVTAAVETGLVAAREPETPVLIDTCAGVVETVAHVRDGMVRDVTLSMRESYLALGNQHVKTEEHGEVPVDVAVGAGNVFAIVDAATVGVRATVADVPAAIWAGLALRSAVREQLDLSGVPGGDLSLVDLVEPVSRGRTRNVLVWGAGAIDRAPCGTGTCARLALLHARGELDVAQPLVNSGVLDTEFTGMITAVTATPFGAAVLADVTGTAYVTAMTKMLFHPDDPFRAGYLLPA